MPVVRTTAPLANSRPSASRTPVDPVLDQEVVDLAFDDRQIRRLPDRLLHRRRIELAIGLGARTAHRRSFAAIEHAKLNAAGIGDPAHQAVQRIDLADQMALAEAADRRIAGHRADGRKALGDQRRARAHARGRSRGLAAGMAAADDNHIEAAVHRNLQEPGRSSQAQNIRSKAPRVASVSRETAADTIGVVNESFTNTEIAKDHVQNIFDIDPPVSRPSAVAAERSSSAISSSCSPGLRRFGQSPIERGDRLLKRVAMPRAGHDAALRPSKNSLWQSQPSRSTSASIPAPVAAEIETMNLIFIHLSACRALARATALPDRSCFATSQICCMLEHAAPSNWPFGRRPMRQ